MFDGERVIVTEKMDGENTSLYADGMHARSVDGAHHPSRDWVKNYWASVAYKIPYGWRVCGENLYAIHSIEYHNLRSYFLAFSVWNADNMCLSWDETVKFLSERDIPMVPVIYDGPFQRQVIENISVDSETSEGYVMRIARAFHYNEFGKSVAKYVRQDHVQTDVHWKHQEIRTNTLRGRENT